MKPKTKKILKISIMLGLIFFILLEYIFYFKTRQLILNMEFETISLISFLYLSIGISILMMLSQNFLLSKRDKIRKLTSIIIPILGMFFALLFTFIFRYSTQEIKEWNLFYPYSLFLSSLFWDLVVGLFSSILIITLVFYTTKFYKKIKILPQKKLNKRTNKIVKITLVIFILLFFLYPAYKIADRFNLFSPGIHEYATCGASGWHIGAVYKRSLIYGKGDILITEKEERGINECYVIRSYIKPTFVVDASSDRICEDAIVKYYIDNKEYDACYTNDGLSSSNFNGESILTVGHNLKRKFTDGLCKYHSSKEMCYKQYVNYSKEDASICRKMGNLKEKCYFNFAIEKNNEEYCKKSGEFKDKCYLNLEVMNENLSPKMLEIYFNSKISKNIKVKKNVIYNTGFLGRESGSFSIENLNKFNLDSKKFRLYINYNLEDADGCSDDEEIPSGMACILNFQKSLEVNDILEVTYEGERILMIRIREV